MKKVYGNRISRSSLAKRNISIDDRRFGVAQHLSAFREGGLRTASSNFLANE